jgi:hypothetical protein
MKFISKSANLLIVLRAGIPAQPITGTPPTPTISVRFKDGVADVQQDELIEMMVKHPGFNNDFVSAENVQAASFETTHKMAEPVHILTEMQFGTPVSRKIGGFAPLPPELQNLVKTMAVDLAKSMLPGMIEETLKGIMKAHEADKKPVEKTPVASTKVKGKPGRPPKAKITEPVVQNPITETENQPVQEQVS